MRRGCISLGEIKCAMCGKMVPNAQRYLAVDEETGEEVEQGGTVARYCVDCCLKKGYADYRMEKGEKVITFFPEKIEEKLT